MRRIYGVAFCVLSSAAVLAAAPDPAKGKAVFSQNCAGCHATSDQKMMGPGLKGLFKKDKLANGQKPTEAAVRAKIDAGGSAMPAYKNTLKPEQKDDLIAYLKTL